MTYSRTIDQLRQDEAQRKRERDYMNDRPEIWRPTITEREAEQRKKDIEANILPF